TVLENRTWIVPPGFLSNQGPGNDIQLNADPFADAGADQGVAGSVLVKRKTAKEYLMENGIVFGEGTSANYNPTSSTLLVRNTPDQISLVDSLVQSAREGVGKMVEVSLKMISISQNEVKQFGVDTFLGQFNLGATPRVFAGGGTPGVSGGSVSSSGVPTTPFVNPGTTTPVGSFPLSSGLRSGNFATGNSIDDVIANNLATNGPGPSVFSIAGVFTDPQFQANLRMVSQAKSVDFLCDTKLLIRPGQRGKVEIQREFIYPTEYDPPEVPNGIVGTTSSANPNTIPIVPATPTAFEMRPLGKIVEVEPTVSQDNHTVSLEVLVEFTEFSGFVNYGTPIPGITENRILMPVFDVVREVTSISLWDGQSVAIGGLHGHSVVDTEDKIPFVGDLPVFGRMFRSTTNRPIKDVVLIFASVRLIDPGGLPINSEITQNDANEFPPRSGRPPYTAPPAFAAPSMPYQK
ncbi:MAG: type II and III secretion system protein, partial [Verrucomicrobiales bacterium]|nr:type II and III secretion system protein [Verrucomicrobiales bacterium]